MEVLDNPNFAGDHDIHHFKITASVFDVVNIPDNPSESFYTGQVYVGIKDAVFEPSTALRYLCEQFKVLEMEGLSERSIHAFRSDGGPEHRVRNGSVQVALICYFFESKCDLVIGLSTCPTQSWTSPAERVMPVLNLAWGNTSLCRSKMPNNEDEEYIKDFCSMKELRKKVQGDPAKKAISDGQCATLQGPSYGTSTEYVLFRAPTKTRSSFHDS